MVKQFAIEIVTEPMTTPRLGNKLYKPHIGTRAGIPYKRISYYLSSLKPTSERIALGIRQHWHIENRLHWVKDVIMDEDKSPQKAGFAPINLSILKTWVLTLLRLHGYDSITEAISLLSHKIKQIHSLWN